MPTRSMTRSQLPKMVKLPQSGAAELVVGSRYISRQRRQLQQAAVPVACHRDREAVLRVEIKDPMSAFKRPPRSPLNSWRW